MTAVSPPLVVDLDGTLTPTDTLAESCIRLIRRSPFNLFLLFFWLLKGLVPFKARVASQVDLAAERLPFRGPLLEYLRDQKAKGRRLILATASHEKVAAAVSRHLGIFDEVIATDSQSNLKGENKLKAIQAAIGEDFVYAGDSSADVVIWKSASAAVLVDTSNAIAKTVRATTPIEAEFPRERNRLRTWIRALRIHQWSKNLLIFVPLLTAFAFFEVDKAALAVVAFFAFSLAASATYIVNDLWDLESDRAHPRKVKRPLASGEIAIVEAVAAAGGLLVAAFLLALTVSPLFLLTLGMYLLVTSFYSWFLKRIIFIDVIVLAVLYAIRILAGSAAIEVAISTWLMVFSVFVFLSLALIKRCSELVDLEKAGGEATHGRDYRVSDLAVLWPLGVSSGMSAVVVLGLFISEPETTARYGSPALLWLVALGLIYWLARLWIKTGRGEMHDDPIVFAIRDAVGRLVVVGMIVAIVCAYFIQWHSIFP